MIKQYWKKGKKAVKILKKKGIVGLYYSLNYRYVTVPEFKKQFEKWQLWEKETLKKEPTRSFDYRPLISIIVPVYNVAGRILEECIESVLNQSMDNWELCIADDASTEKEVKTTLKKYENHPKVKIIYREKNGHISNASNSAIALSSGEYIAFLDCDDILSKNAVYEMTRKLNENKKYDFIYSDEDKIDEDGRLRHTPHFKPDWSPDTLLSHMYTCHFAIYRKKIAEETGLLRAGYEGSQDYDFALRFTEKTDQIGHIPKILYHWRERKESTSVDPEAKPYVFEATKKAKMDAMARRGIKASLEKIEDTYQYRIVYAVEGNPLISIVIVSGDCPAVLIKCLKSLVLKTEYKKYEIIIIDNSKNKENKNIYKKICRKYHAGYLYGRKNNKGELYNLAYKSGKIKGSYFLFLEDSIEIKNGIWLERLLGQAIQKHTGIVGAKLVTSGRAERIISAGVITQKEKPRHIFHGMSDHAAYYFSRNRMEYNYAAVSGKCMMVSRELFETLGGFNEKFLYYYDVELCYHAMKYGYFNVIRNDAVLYCHRDNARGNDRECEFLYQLYPEQKNDPYYNCNLTQKKLDCGIGR